MTLEQLLEQIKPKNEAAEQQARRRWNACAKPLGSLGLLEVALCQIAAVTGSADIDLEKKALLIFCADNGVVAQGVTQTGSEITALVARGFAQGTTPACRMARICSAWILPAKMPEITASDTTPKNTAEKSIRFLPRAARALLRISICMALRALPFIFPLHSRMSPLLFRLSLFLSAVHQLSVRHAQDPVCHLGRFLLVRDKDHSLVKPGGAGL